jgi:hypothetical protein
MRILRSLTLLTLALVVTAIPSTAAAQPGSQQAVCFPEVPAITACIDPAFVAYWRTNGGLPVFGYPITPSTAVKPEESGGATLVQWFERNRLEFHPGAPAAYRVQLGRAGADRLQQLGRDHWADGGEAGPQPGCLWFAETRQNVCDQGRGAGFKTYWERNGLRITGLNAYQRSLALFGLPLTAATPEPGPNGELILTQWFERARFEWQADQAGQFKVYLGLLGNERTAPPAASSMRFGVELNRNSVAGSVGTLSGFARPLVRFNLIDWAAIEPRQGERNWAAIAAQEAELAAIVAAGGEPMVGFGGLSPAWAQQVPDKSCGPIKPEALPAFASYVGEIVKRYSAPPFNVRYWELGNEPDAPYQLLPSDAPFGCWGNTEDPDFGGAAYGNMLKAVYPAIKAASPDSQVILGGLLLNCEPTPNSGCKEGRFIEGVLKSGGAAGFDILAYHSYVYHDTKGLDWDRNHPGWSHRGGALIGKASYLREVMARYGVDKPLLMNEGALLCYRFSPLCPAQGFYEAQPIYAARTFVRSHELKLYGLIWYTLNGPGWQDGGLLDAQQQPRPVYRTLQLLTSTLAGATYEGATRDGTLEAHRFRKGGTRYEIVWMNDSTTRELPLPAGARRLLTLTGAERPLGERLVVGFEPVIVETAAQ